MRRVAKKSSARSSNRVLGCSLRQPELSSRPVSGAEALGRPEERSGRRFPCALLEFQALLTEDGRLLGLSTRVERGNR